MDAAAATAGIRIGDWRADPATLNADIDMLAGVLHAIVHSGAGVSFVVPFSMDEARGFWRDKVLPGVRTRTRRVRRRSDRRHGPTRSRDDAQPAAPRGGVQVARASVALAARHRARAD